MFLNFAVAFVLIFPVVKSDVAENAECKDVYKDIHTGKVINIIDNCGGTTCITKCCAFGEIIGKKNMCIKFPHPNKIKFNTTSLYSWNGVDVKETKKKLQYFQLIQNEKFNNNNNACSNFDYPSDRQFYILEDGSVKLEELNSLRKFVDVEKLKFCVEFKIFVKIVDNVTKPFVKLILRENYDELEAGIKSKFIATGMLVSCVFMFLVLVVYSLLPQLRSGIAGLMLMAYVSSMFVMYLLKVVTTFGRAILTSDDCKIISPVIYFAVLSSFFWLNIMSFDTWWSLRAFRKSRDRSQKTELRKFMRYALYGWGIPLLIAAVVTILDNIDINKLPGVVDPAFKDCFADDDSVTIYINIPIGIIMAVNIIFFITTVYNIWLIKRAVNVNPDSRKSKKDTNRFGVYANLAVIMGVGWCLELIPDVRLWLFILINLNNLLIGVVIFFVFVFKKNVLNMLLERFGIRSECFKYLENSRTSSSKMSRSTKTTDDSQATFLSSKQHESIL